MIPLSNKEHILEKIKEIFNFIFHLMLICICIAIIAGGCIKLNLDFLGFAPFVYFSVIIMNKVGKIVEEKENLENSLAYYKNCAEKYEKILNDAIHKESLWNNLKNFTKN